MEKPDLSHEPFKETAALNFYKLTAFLSLVYKQKIHFYKNKAICELDAEDKILGDKISSSINVQNRHLLN